MPVRRRRACDDAADLLRENGHKPKVVAGVHVDAILWVDSKDRPKTTFVNVLADKHGTVIDRELFTVDGFQAEEV